MTIYEHGDVVYIPFRFTQNDRLKSRPGVVVSTRAFHESRSDVVIAGITSNLGREDFVGRYVIEDWPKCGLARPSAISGIIQTVRDSQIRERIGSLSRDDQDGLNAALREALGL